MREETSKLWAYGATASEKKHHIRARAGLC